MGHTGDPVREFEHTHEQLTKLAREAGRLLRASPGPQMADDDMRRLRRCLESLRDELLQHFAVEEEGLFPFIRSSVPSKLAEVERLALAHDAICGAVVRLAHAAAGTERNRGATLAALYDRFETAYALHSREEADLLAELGRCLDDGQRARLGAVLDGL